MKENIRLALAVLFGLVCVPVASEAQQGLAFRFSGGWQDVGGDYGEVLDGHVDAEFTILYALQSIRLGAGSNWVSFAMDDHDDESWNQIKGYALIAVPFSLGSSVGAYVEGRLTFRRLRPEGKRYFDEEEEFEELSDFVAAGNGLEVVAGLEIPLGTGWALDLSGAFGRFGTGTDLSSQGFGPIDSGSTWRLHAGFLWFAVR